MAVKYKLNWELVVYKPYMVLNSGLKCISYCQRIHSFKYIYFRGSYGFATWLHFISSCHRLFLSAMSVRCQLCVSTHLGTSQLCTSNFFWANKTNKWTYTKMHRKLNRVQIGSKKTCNWFERRSGHSITSSYNFIFTNSCNPLFIGFSLIN